MIDVGKEPGAVRTRYQLICPKCGKPAIRREVRPDGVAYLHLTKHGSARHFITPPDTARGGNQKRKGEG